MKSVNVGHNRNISIVGATNTGDKKVRRRVKVKKRIYTSKTSQMFCWHLLNLALHDYQEDRAKIQGTMRKNDRVGRYLV